MKIIMTLGFAFLSLSALMTSTKAAPQCGPHEKITEVLYKRFLESRQALGLAGQASVIELFVSDKGTWTLTATTTAGRTCVIATGEAWQEYPKRIAGLDS
jgi:cation diffusion facilitator CzcD-associated flavoprotein CzcO